MAAASLVFEGKINIECFELASSLAIMFGTEVADLNGEHFVIAVIHVTDNDNSN